MVIFEGGRTSFWSKGELRPWLIGKEGAAHKSRKVPCLLGALRRNDSGWQGKEGTTGSHMLEGKKRL